MIKWAHLEAPVTLIEEQLDRDCPEARLFIDLVQSLPFQNGAVFGASTGSESRTATAKTARPVGLER
jgi:hypothetical protein